MTSKTSTKVFGAGLTALLSAAVGGLGGWIAYSSLGVDHAMPLPAAMGASRQRYLGRTGRTIHYYFDRSGEGNPLVLIHSINAAASAYEMRPIFEHYRRERPVYALELPGFGFSERADDDYTPELYADEIACFLREEVGQPADVVALSLSSEFAARAALENPDLFHSLVLISPTGFMDGIHNEGPPLGGHSSVSSVLHPILSVPLWSQALYDRLTSQASIHHFLQKSFAGPVDVGLEEYSYLSAHQPNARYAPLRFIAGKLFTPHIREEVYERLQIPVLVLYDEDEYVTFEALPHMVQQDPNWQSKRITPTRGLPHFEKMRETGLALDQFWQRVSEATPFYTV